MRDEPMPGTGPPTKPWLSFVVVDEVKDEEMAFAVLDADLLVTDLPEDAFALLEELSKAEMLEGGTG